jgi:opacity protein-like surface antigen
VAFCPLRSAFHHCERFQPVRAGCRSSGPNGAGCAGRLCDGVFVGGFLPWGALGWIETKPEYTTGAVVLGAPFVVSSASSKNGLSYGLLSGYNYQMGQLVVGVEGDFTGWTVGKIRYTAITGDFLTAHSEWGGSIRGRPGYAADRALLYVTGGAAFVSNETSIPFTGISIGGDGTRWGWTVGGGLDYAITNNWFTGIFSPATACWKIWTLKNALMPLSIVR